MHSLFGEWVENKIALDPHYVNKQNYRIWFWKNIIETPLNPQNVTVMRVLWPNGIIGKYFFKNHADQNATINKEHYRSIRTDFFVPWLNFTTRQMKKSFDERIILCNRSVNWPSRSCELNPLHSFLFRYMKSLAYADIPGTNSRRVIANMQPHVLENWIDYYNDFYYTFMKYSKIRYLLITYIRQLQSNKSYLQRLKTNISTSWSASRLPIKYGVRLPRKPLILLGGNWGLIALTGFLNRSCQLSMKLCNWGRTKD